MSFPSFALCVFFLHNTRRQKERDSERTSDGGETWIVPPGDPTGIDEPVKFSFRQESVDKVQPTKVPDVDRTNAESFNHPVVLGISIPVLVRS